MACADCVRRSSAAVATSREGHRSPRSALEVLRRRWGWVDTRLDAAMIFPVNKIPIFDGYKDRGAHEMVALALRPKNRSDSRSASSYPAETGGGHVDQHEERRAREG